MPLTVHTEVGAGSILPLGGSERGGLGIEDTSRVEGADPLVMEIRIDIGTFRIYYMGAGPRRDGVVATPGPKPRSPR